LINEPLAASPFPASPLTRQTGKRSAIVGGAIV